MEIEELVKILIVVVVLILLIGIVVFVLKEQGFEGVLGEIKNLLRFGRS